MSSATLDVVGIGNAIVDVIAHADERFLATEGLAKGAMALIDAERAQRSTRRWARRSRARAARPRNTMAGIASLGGRAAAYIGKVRDDQLGEVFRHDIPAIGVRFDTPPARRPRHGALPDHGDAGRAAHDGTFLGACVELGPEDIDEALIGAAQVTYLEGYLFDPPRAQEAFRRAARAHRAGRKVALTLSDPFCVDRHRAAFRELVAREVDILFANEPEICSLYETDDFDDAAAAVRGHVAVAALTRSAQGSVVLGQGEAHHVPAAPVARSSTRPAPAICTRRASCMA